jgi:hypothetical protein
MSDDRTKADKAWEARQEAARYRIFNAVWPHDATALSVCSDLETVTA